jgi:outer membrane protein OmpA-like peptidoglycan-associated protein
MRPTSDAWCPALPLGLALTLLLAACASDRDPPLLGSVRGRNLQGKAPVVAAVPTPAPGLQQPGATMVAGSGTPGPAEDETASVIYFDPDEYQVKESYRPMLLAYAKRLIADPELHLRIDGHTDDTGPADYNLDLARTRAQMVMKQLVGMGVPPAQLQIVGHGKGRPKAKGTGAQAQAANRRVELTYR